MRAKRSEMRKKRAKRLGLIPRILLRRSYYSVAEAGAKVDLSRGQSYRAVALGEIPIVMQGRMMLVPRREWDARVRSLLASARLDEKKQSTGRPPVRAKAAAADGPSTSTSEVA